MKHRTPIELNQSPGNRANGAWSKIGGGALTVAIGFHAILLIIAAICIFRV